MIADWQKQVLKICRTLSLIYPFVFIAVFTYDVIRNSGMHRDPSVHVESLMKIFLVFIGIAGLLHTIVAGVQPPHKQAAYFKTWVTNSRQYVMIWYIFTLLIAGFGFILLVKQVLSARIDEMYSIAAIVFILQPTLYTSVCTNYNVKTSLSEAKHQC